MNEQLEKIEKKMAQLKAQKQAILNKEKVKERKARTHRLVQIGALAEKSFGIKSPDEYEVFFTELKEKSGL